MALVEVISEAETPRGWAYEVSIAYGDGSTTRHAVTLSWADHDFWTGGRVAPSETIGAVVRYLVRRAPEHPVPARFDAATVRRWFPEADREIMAGEPD